MSAESDKSLDVLGIKPFAESVNTVTKGSVDGASAFLGRICLPAAEEFGLFLKDKVSNWRSNNSINIANKAQKILYKEVGDLIVSAHPRIIHSTIEHGSWADDDFMQNLWAGLLASSCTVEGNDESNLILIDLLSKLTTHQAKLVNYICDTANTYKSPAGWIVADTLKMSSEEILQITGITDLQQLDRELDHLRELGLIESGFNNYSMIANVTPLPLCLQLYVRANGYVGSPIDYFGAVEKSTNKTQEPI